MPLFFDIEVTPTVAADSALAKKLVEVCPVNIFALGDDGRLRVVAAQVDECTLCELCLNAAPPGAVRIKRRYGDGEVLQRK